MRGITVPTVQAGHAIGVDLGGTKILGGVVARDGSVVRRHERPAPQDSQEHVLAELEAAVVELLDDSVAAVGFGAPSPIDQAGGVVVRCVNLPLENAPLRDQMHERFGLPVGLDNDANSAAGTASRPSSATSSSSTVGGRARARAPVTAISRRTRAAALVPRRRARRS